MLSFVFAWWDYQYCQHETIQAAPLLVMRVKLPTLLELPCSGGVEIAMQGMYVHIVLMYSSNVLMHPSNV